MLYHFFMHTSVPLATLKIDLGMPKALKLKLGE